jgi:ATP-dependent DNA helicase RecQ
VLSRQRDVLLRRDPERTKSRSRSTSSGGKGKAPAVELTGPAAGLFEQLRSWRAATAKEQGVPAYVIFHDATLRAIAADAPTSLAELSKISGVGENKLAKYGEGVLETLGSTDGD